LTKDTNLFSGQTLENEMQLMHYYWKN